MHVCDRISAYQSTCVCVCVCVCERFCEYFIMTHRSITLILSEAFIFDMTKWKVHVWLNNCSSIFNTKSNLAQET